MKRNSFFRNNGLTIVFTALFVIFLVGQSWTGWKEHNQELEEAGKATIGYITYLGSGHFLQATFENWESEFLQMALFIILSACLYQKGSAESKSPDEKEDVDREPSANRKDAPWPVKKGGAWLKLYSVSLSVVFMLIFLVSFILHLYGSMRDHNQQQEAKGENTTTMGEYLFNNRFWFESFQNWQSEFLSVAAIVLLTVFLRQKGSAQSKPVDAPDSDNK